MNMFLGREPVNRFGLLDRRRMIAETETLVKELDVRIPSAHATIRDLSGGQRQGVAIARATHWASKLILLDEPTAALGVAETAKVEEIVESLKRRNIGVLIISHSLDRSSSCRIASACCAVANRSAFARRRRPTRTRSSR
jgi:simple sugar transport system ATP-binding protein